MKGRKTTRYYEYTELRKPIDEYISGLLAEIHSLKSDLKTKPKDKVIVKETGVKNATVLKDNRYLKAEVTNLKKKMFSKEVEYLKQIDELKTQLDNACYRLELCAQGVNMLDILNIYDE